LDVLIIGDEQWPGATDWNPTLMFRPRHLNAPCPIILKTPGDGTVAAACAPADNPRQSGRLTSNAGLRQ
jgi:hypothetical protein